MHPSSFFIKFRKKFKSCLPDNDSYNNRTYMSQTILVIFIVSPPTTELFLSAILSYKL